MLVILDLRSCWYYGQREHLLQQCYSNASFNKKTENHLAWFDVVLSLNTAPTQLYNQGQIKKHPKMISTFSYWRINHQKKRCKWYWGILCHHYFHGFLPVSLNLQDLVPEADSSRCLVDDLVAPCNLRSAVVLKIRWRWFKRGYLSETSTGRPTWLTFLICISSVGKSW